MKQLHREDFFGWSAFDEARDLDFHSVFWAHPSGNVVIDPLPLRGHDEAHIARLGGVSTIIVTNSDHVRDARRLAELTSAHVFGPRAERDALPLSCDGFLADGDEPAPGVRIIELDGSKTPGELAILIERTTLVTGDLIRGHRGGRLNLLPDQKLTDRALALRSLERLAGIASIEAVLVGDGWPVFRDGARALQELLRSSMPDDQPQRPPSK